MKKTYIRPEVTEIVMPNLCEQNYTSYRIDGKPMGPITVDEGDPGKAKGFGGWGDDSDWFSGDETPSWD
jgi:hypothetical protein